MLSLGTKIKKIRELRNLKQETIAEILGISQPAYSKMEKDETEISSERLEQIAKAFGLTVQDILSFDEHAFFSQVNRQKSGIINQHESDYTINQYGMGDNERKLYEDKIKLMEEMIDNLKKEVERLKSQIGATN